MLHFAEKAGVQHFLMLQKYTNSRLQFERDLLALTNFIRKRHNIFVEYFRKHIINLWI